MNKTVIVTGGAKGIGAAIVKEFAFKGYNVCINYNTSEKQANDLKKDLIEKGCNVEIFCANVADRKKVDEMVEFTLNRFGSIDVVVNNAGICEYKLFTDITNEDLDKMYNSTVVGTFNVTQSALKKYMINKKDGVIINIASIWGMVGASCEVNYSTAKSAVIGMTKALAKELGPSNIRVNAVAPGAIFTDMMANLSEETISNFKEEIPLNKIGKVEDIAGIVEFLASEKGEYITGQVISPNGGVVII